MPLGLSSPLPTQAVSSRLMALQSQVHIWDSCRHSKTCYAFNINMHFTHLHVTLTYNFRSLHTTAESVTQLLLYLKLFLLLHSLCLQSILEVLFKENACFLHRKGPCVESQLKCQKTWLQLEHFMRTPTEEALSFEMLNTLSTMDGGQESFSSHLML